MVARLFLIGASVLVTAAAQSTEPFPDSIDVSVSTNCEIGAGGVILDSGEVTDQDVSAAVSCSTSSVDGITHFSKPFANRHGYGAVAVTAGYDTNGSEGQTVSSGVALWTVDVENEGSSLIQYTGSIDYVYQIVTTEFLNPTLPPTALIEIEIIWISSNDDQNYLDTRSVIVEKLGVFEDEESVTFETPVLQPGESGQLIVKATSVISSQAYPSSDAVTLGVQVKLNPCQDDDEDGLCNDWEMNGYDHDLDGEIDIDFPNIPNMGADPNIKDLYVEIDSQQGYFPMPGVLERVRKSFLENGGIRLHFVSDEKNLPVGPIAFGGDIGAGIDSKRELFQGTVDERQSRPEVVEAKKLLWRYGYFGKELLPGSEITGGYLEGSKGFVVTLGNWNGGAGGNSNEEAGTLMHELGHALGLGHGGRFLGKNDTVNCKPNYISVMNYVWQTPKVSTSAYWRLNYSSELAPTLQQLGLVENEGIGLMGAIYQGQKVPFRRVGDTGNNTQWASISTGTSVDWNNNGFTDVAPVVNDLQITGVIEKSITNISGEFSSESGCIKNKTPAELETLRGSQDWSQLVISPVANGLIANGVGYGETSEEISEEENAVLDEIAIEPNVDYDLDGVEDQFDNCRTIANASQIDSDNDLIGNACDGDFNNDCEVDYADVEIMKSVYLTTNEDADLNWDGVVDNADAVILKGMLYTTPGPANGQGPCGL